MYRPTALFAAAFMLAGAVPAVSAQDNVTEVSASVDTPFRACDYVSASIATDSVAERPAYFQLIDSMANERPYDELVGTLPLPDYFFIPAVYDHYEFPQGDNMISADLSGRPEMRWIEEHDALQSKMKTMKYNLFYSSPDAVFYNVGMLPEAPKEYHAVVNPEDHTIEIRELPGADQVAPTIEVAPVKKRHWLRTFTASLQFSQAYVSPNWYQGGNNNLNMLGNIYYNVKLNQEYHPNLLFETTAQYKLGMNNAPDDEVHDYNISDDLFQINSTFGLKAARRWYYSLNAQFKTQLLNSYASNSMDLRSSFLSPGELTAGIGMTYNYENQKKTVKFDMSLAPLSYNMWTCINNRIDETAYNIEPGRNTVHKIGSSAEFKVAWKIMHNISLSSRLFVFTDYGQIQGDWENTVPFAYTRFLPTPIYVHARYDSKTPPCEDPGWHKLQVKEILSIGFAYKFSSI